MIAKLRTLYIATVHAQTYEPDILDKYYAARPLMAWKRTLQLATAFSGFAVSLISDRIFNRAAENEVLRAAQLR